MWLLIVLFLPTSNHDGKAITAVEYNSQEACKQAKEAVMTVGQGEISAVCTFKGSEE